MTRETQEMLRFAKVFRIFIFCEPPRSFKAGAMLTKHKDSQGLLRFLAFSVFLRVARFILGSGFTVYG
jgi:hypothetical protein